MVKDCLFPQLHFCGGKVWAEALEGTLPAPEAMAPSTGPYKTSNSKIEVPAFLGAAEVNPPVELRLDDALDLADELPWGDMDRKLLIGKTFHCAGLIQRLEALQTLTSIHGNSIPRLDCIVPSGGDIAVRCAI